MEGADHSSGPRPSKNAIIVDASAGGDAVQAGGHRLHSVRRRR